MKRSSMLAVLLVCLLALPLLAITPSIVKPKPAPKPQKAYAPAKLPHKIARSRSEVPVREWTVLYYLDADNNLEPDMLNDMDEMERIGSTEQVNEVALTDRTPEYETRDGNWTNSKVFYITRDSDDHKLTSKVIEDFPEMDMADPQTLARFVAFGMSNFPAKHYAVVLGDHGGTWMSSLNDETNNENGLTLPGLISALEALKASGAPKLDLLMFDMCLMDQLEVMDAIAPYASYAVASEELEPGFGQPNHRILYHLTKNPQITAHDFSAVIVKEFNDACKEAGDDTVTLAAIDLGKIGAVTTAVDNLAQALQQAPQDVMTAVGRARSAAQHFPGNTDDDLNSFDIGSFAGILAQQPEASSLKPQLDAVNAAVQGAVIAHGEGAAHQGATGLAIYFPFGQEVNPGYKNVPLTRTQWDEFISGQGSHAAAATASVKITSPDPSVPQKMGAGFPVTATVAGTPSTIHASVAYLNEKQEATVVYDEEILNNGKVPQWKDGQTLTYQVKPEVTGITDGKSTAIAPLYPMSPGNRYSQAYASYNSMRGDQKVSVVFDTKTGNLATIFCNSENGRLMPMSVRPVKGENLVFYQVTLAGKDKAQRFTPTKGVTTSMSFSQIKSPGGAQGGDSKRPSGGVDKPAGKEMPSLRLFRTALPKGNYVFMLTAYGPDGAPSGYDVVPFTAEGENVPAEVAYPNAGYPSVSSDDVDYVDLKEVVGDESYDHFDATWDDYDYTDELEADDYSAEDLSYLKDEEIQEDDVNLNDDQLLDYDSQETLTHENESDDQEVQQEDNDSGSDQQMEDHTTHDDNEDVDQDEKSDDDHDQGNVEKDEKSDDDQDQGEVENEDHDSGHDQDKDEEVNQDSDDQDHESVDQDEKSDDDQDQGDDQDQSNDDDSDDDGSGHLSLLSGQALNYTTVAAYVNRALPESEFRMFV